MTYRPRLNPHWMQGVKGCFVCGEPHNANAKHPREQVTASINRLKANHPRALLTIEDLAAVVEMTGPADEEEGIGDDYSGPRKKKNWTKT